MADITMCTGEQLLPLRPDGVFVAVKCFRKENCYRFTAKPNPFRQSWFAIIPVNVEYNEAGEETQQCDELWLNNKLFGGL